MRPDLEAPHTTLAVLLQGHQIFALRYGIEPEAFCKHASIPRDAVTSPDAEVPYEWLLASWKSLIELLPRVDVGIEIGLFWTLDRLGALGEAARHVPSSVDLLHLVARLSQVTDTARSGSPLRVEEAGDVIRFVVPSSTWVDVVERPEALSFFLVAQLRLRHGDRLSPLRAEFDYDRERLRQRYETFFGCEVRFGCAETRLVFAREPLETPVPGASAEAYDHCAAYVERVLARTPERALTTHVRRAIASELSHGTLDQTSIARSLGMSSRSLQRKLTAAGVSYRALENEHRRLVAERLLSTTEQGVSEVAAASGYSDAQSFLRAFRRWTGSTPAEFRRARQRAARPTTASDRPARDTHASAAVEPHRGARTDPATRR